VQRQFHQQRHHQHQQQHRFHHDERVTLRLERELQMEERQRGYLPELGGLVRPRRRLRLRAGGELYHSGTTYGTPTVASRGTNSLDIFFRGMDSRLWQKGWNGSSWSSYIQLGGVITGDPAAVGESGASSRLDIVAPNTDHGNPGVWWKYWPFNAGCLVEGSCGSCGCDDDPLTPLPACIR
jgi:hypothetical protein